MLIELSKYSLPPALGAFATLGLGLFVFLNNKRAEPNRVLALMCLAIFIWLAAYAIAYSTGNDLIAVRCARTACTSVAFVSLFFYHFAIAFLGLEREKKYLRLCYFITWIFLVGFVFTDLLLSGTRKYYWGYYSKAGVLHPLYLLITYAMWFRSFYLLFVSVRKQVSPEIRNKIKYALIAFIVVVPCTIDYLPKYGFEFYPFGWTFVVLFVSTMAYVIVRHRVLEIEVVIKRTLVFAGLVGSVVVVVSMVAFVSQDLLARVVTIPEWLSSVLAAGIIAGVYGPLRNWLVNVTDKYLFQKKYDYKELLKKFTDEVMLKVDLKQLVETTVNTLSNTVKLEGCSLLLMNKDTREYIQAAGSGVHGEARELHEDEPFIKFLRQTHEPIGKDGELGKVRFPEEVTERLKQLNARLCLPLEVHEELIGVLCLGKKKSDEEFTKDDLDILLPLAKTLGIAISNAELFDELAKTQAEAAQKEKLAVIGTLSAGINHEICNPLGIVKAQCEAFALDEQDGLLVGKSQKELLERVSSIIQVTLKQIDRATAITQKLSSFAKPIKTVAAEQVSVEHEVDEVVLLVGHDLELQKITIEKEIQPDLSSIMVDRRQFQEVLFNLIRNAGQAINPPGTITVRAKEVAERVRIEIADTGSGIPADKLEKIYDPFFTTKEPGKGTGLGLFIVRQIIERNKGRISVESTVGKGTTFFLDFPTASRQPALA